MRGAAYASGKTLFLLNLLTQLSAEGHKTLVFSQVTNPSDFFPTRFMNYVLCGDPYVTVD